MKRGFYVGRFQPFHIGHLAAIKEMDKAPDLEQIVIGIGSSQYSNQLKNPFTAEERELMIRKTLDNLAMSKPYNIVKIPDIHDYPKWVLHVQELTPEFQVVYVPGSSIVQELFKNARYEVRKPKVTHDISATKVRQLMYSDHDWTEYVTPQVVQLIEEVNGVNRLRAIASTLGIGKIDLSKILVVPRLSKYEWDMREYKLGHDQLIEQYRRDGEDIGRILGSHSRQKESLEELKMCLHESQFIEADQLTREIAKNAPLIIALGGDDHFKYVSHFVDNNFILGVNSDIVRSAGALTYFTPKGFDSVLIKLEKGEFYVEEWIRLQAEVNGSKKSPAVSEYYLGEINRRYISSHKLILSERSEEQKCSGLLVVTGSGSTGWYDSANRYIFPNGNRVPKDEKFARFLVTEPYRGRLSGYSMLEGIIEEGRELIVVSFNKHNGILSADSIDDYGFKRGSVATIRIADKPLKVISGVN